MSAVMPLAGVIRTWRGRPNSVEIDPGCLKTCMSRECTELFSLFPPFDGDCQSYSFLIHRNRDRLSTRKSDVGVFTQPRSKADVKQQMLDVRSSLSFGARSVHQ